ncbi:hypothetical protein Tco_0098376 [Tanacetum coccineum]
MSQCSSWDDVLAKLSARLSKWKLKTLSIGGRLTLIKSVLSSIPLYQMSLYKVPMSVLNIMESSRRNFFNGVNITDRRIAMIGWKKILVSKKKEGSEFLVFAFNHALVFKWIWRFIYHGSLLWSRFIKAIYGDRGALDNPRMVSRCSPWLNIIREFDALSSKGIDLNSLVKKKVGNGDNTYFWDDIWLVDLPLKQLYPRLYALENDIHVSVAAKLRDSSLISTFRRAPRGGVEEEKFRLLAASTNSIILPGINDRWVWSLESSGDFSVKSARSYIDDLLLPTVGVPTRWINF